MGLEALRSNSLITGRPYRAHGAQTCVLRHIFSHHILVKFDQSRTGTCRSCSRASRSSNPSDASPSILRSQQSFPSTLSTGPLEASPNGKHLLNESPLVVQITRHCFLIFWDISVTLKHEKSITSLAMALHASRKVLVVRWSISLGVIPLKIIDCLMPQAWHCARLCCAYRGYQDRVSDCYSEAHLQCRSSPTVALIYDRGACSSTNSILGWCHCG